MSVPSIYFSGGHILGIGGSLCATGSSAAFTPQSGFSISAPGGFADGQSITITGPAGSFGTKPNGAKIALLCRYGAGFLSNTPDPLSRASYTDGGFPAQGQTGPSSGNPGLQSSTTAPGSGNAFQTIFPGAAVITGTLTNGSPNITGCSDNGVAGATAFASIDYGFGGIVAGNSSFQYVTSPTQSNLGSNQIALTTNFTGTTGSYTINIAYGPDQFSCPRPTNSAAQDQLAGFRGMNTFPFRSANFNLQNNKFIRLFNSGLKADLAWATDGTHASIFEVYNEGTTNSGLVTTPLNPAYTWTANQWFTHTVMYHGNTSSGGTDGGLIHVADGSTILGSLGTQPSGLNIWGSGGGNITTLDTNDIACRPFMPEGLDTTYTDYLFMDDSCCHIAITGTQGGTPYYEIQWPTAWSDTSVTFVMHRAFIDAIVGAGSLNGLNLVLQKSTYARTTTGAFTAAA
jgi:hypothetical protein